MKFVDSIPPKFIPDESEHVNHFNVVRALINNECNTQSFLPTFLEPGRTNAAFFNPEDPESYSLSLYRSVEELNKATRPIKSFWKKHKGYAIGFTSLKRGISLEINNETGHISYFLQDAYNNNPSEDFSYLEINENEND